MAIADDVVIPATKVGRHTLTTIGICHDYKDTVEIYGRDRNGNCIKSRSMVVPRADLRALAIELLKLTAGPLERLLLQHEVKDVDPSA